MKKKKESQENTDCSNLLRHLDSNSPEQAKTDVNLIPNKIERVKEKFVAVILKYVEQFIFMDTGLRPEGSNCTFGSTL